MNHHYEPTPSNQALRRVDTTPRSMTAAAPGGRAAGGGSAPMQLSPKFLWWVFCRSWRVVLPVGLLLAASVASVLLYQYQPNFRATAILRIEDRSQGLIFNGVSVDSSNGRYVRTQMETMRSDPVLLEVIGDPKAAKVPHVMGANDKLGAIRDRLGIRSIGGSELYQISYNAPSPADAKVMTATIIEKYFSKMRDDNMERQGKVLELLMKLERKESEGLAKAQEQIVSLAKEVTGRDYFSGTVLDPEKAANPLAGLHGRLASIQVAMEVANAERQAIEDAVAVASSRTESNGLLEMRVQQDERIGALNEKIDALTQLKQQLEEKFVDPPSRPDYQQVVAELEGAKQELETAEPEVRAELIAENERRRTEEARKLASEKQNEIRRMEFERAAVQRQYDAKLDDLKVGSGQSAQLELAKADYARKVRIQEMLESKILSLQTEAKAPPKVSLFSPPNASNQPIESAPWKQLFLACGAALVLPFGLAVLREASLRRVMDAEQLYGDTHLRVLGEIASFPTRRVAANPRQLPRSLRREMYAFAESIDALRLSLTHVSEDKEGASVYALTSGVSGESKTSVSVALAMSFANVTGIRTLLIDGDLRDPGVQDLIDLKYTPGLAEVLAGRCKVNEAIQPAPGVEGLFVIRAGDCEKSPHALVRPGRLGELMSFLRSNFDVIVIDTPPVLGASEALSLCAAADATAVCSLRGVSRVRQLRLAVDKLETAGAEVVGAVLSGIPTHGYGYAYAYGYGFRENGREHLEAPSSN
ncbi:polysaccharide biosynthesis tyrosine autokinase [Botrimarina sp.]|uniref:GumC family protein n=1 Tax=Botrimarina sp. TaxID=2795802 RepID=UPI0032EE5528